MKYEEIVDGLIHYPRFRKNPGFITVTQMLKRLNIEDDLPIVHIVGTNGKGSVATMIATTVKNAGYKVGKFTSPHILDIRERMQVNESLMTKEAFLEIYEKMEGAIMDHCREGGQRPTFFEYMLLMALLHFHNEGVALAVLEAGIGGRYDATNAIECRLCSVITDIDYDHVGILGDTLTEIAEDKGDVIRKGVPTVFYNNSMEVAETITRIVKERQSILYEVSQSAQRIRHLGKEGIDFSLENKYYYYEGLTMPVHGAYQAVNAGIAAMALKVIEQTFSGVEECFRESLARFYWPGRMEYIHDHLLIDGGHNLSGVKQVVEYLNTVEQDREIELLYATMQDKSYESIIDALLGIRQLKTVVLVNLENERSVETSTLLSLFQKKHNIQIKEIRDLKGYLSDRCHLVGARTLMVGVGSLYLVSAIKAVIEED